jgi:hypothetical protein
MRYRFALFARPGRIKDCQLAGIVQQVRLDGVCAACFAAYDA